MITGDERYVYILYNTGTLAAGVRTEDKKIKEAFCDVCSTIRYWGLIIGVITGDDRDAFSSILLWGLISRM